MMESFYSSTDHFSIEPALMMALFGCAILLFDFMIFPDPRQRKWLLIFVVLAEGFTGFGLFKQTAYVADKGAITIAFGGSLQIDDFSIFFNWLFLIAALVVAIVSYQYLENAGEHHGEHGSQAPRHHQEAGLADAETGQILQIGRQQRRRGQQHQPHHEHQHHAAEEIAVL